MNKHRTFIYRDQFDPATFHLAYEGLNPAVKSPTTYHAATFAYFALDDIVEDEEIRETLRGAAPGEKIYLTLTFREA